MNPSETIDMKESDSLSPQDDCSNNTHRFVTFGMLKRQVIYAFFTIIFWGAMRVLSFNYKGFPAPEIWDISMICCGVTGWISILMGEWGAMRNKYITWWGLGMLFRGVVPVAIVLAGRVNHPEWESRGIFEAITASYLLTLSLETVLSVNLLNERFPSRLTSPKV